MRPLTKKDELQAIRQRIVETIKPSKVLLAMVDAELAQLERDLCNETSPPWIREQELQRSIFPDADSKN